jgi:hypothetical protein
LKLRRRKPIAGCKPIGLLFLISLAAQIPFAQSEQPPARTINVATIYGSFHFYNIELISEIKDRPCFFVAHITNLTDIAFDDSPTFSVRISGLNRSGQRDFFQLRAVSDYIGNDPLNRYDARGLCPVTIPDIAPDQNTGPL